MSEAEHARMLIYSQDGLGLGHLRRTTLLATEFLAARPGASVLTVSDSPLGQFFSSGVGHDYLKLPSVRKVGPGDWRPVSLSMPFAEVLRLRRGIIRSAALDFDPDVVLVDHMPHGAMGELVPTLEALQGRRVKVVLGLRDILDAPATVRQRWHLEGAFEAVERHFDEVLVYGSHDVFDVSREYAWPAAARSLLHYCGYVCSPPARSGLAAKVRKKYLRHDPAAQLIMVMAGGGADGMALFRAVLDAVPELCRQRRCVVVLVTGPFLPRAEQRELMGRAKGQPVRVIPTVQDSGSHLRAADFVVAMAGYNTTAEILSLGKRTLLVPRPGPSAEQQMRARLFADRGWVRWLPPDQLGPSSVAEAILAGMAAEDLPPAAPPDLDGRQVAAQRLLALLGTDGSAARPTLAAPPLADGDLMPLPAAPATSVELEAEQLMSGG